MTKHVFPSRKVSSKGQVTIPKNLIEDLSKQISSKDLNVKFTDEYQNGNLSRVIIEPEENQENGYNLQKRIEDWKTENGYSEAKARQIIKASMYDYEESTPEGKEL